MRRILLNLTSIPLVAAACGDDDTGTTDPAAATTEVPTTTTTQATTTTADAATALCRATTWNGEHFDVEARMEGGVEWKDGVWTTFTFGIPEDGERGLVVYLDFPDPGIIAYEGNQGYTPTLPAGQVQAEWFEELLIIDLFEVLAGPVRFETPYFLEFTENDRFSHKMWVETEVVSISETSRRCSARWTIASGWR
jgi:hypothetical protein